MTTLKIRGFFTAPANQREKLERERESLLWLAERQQEQYRKYIAAIDEAIAALDAQTQEAKNAAS